MKVSKKLSIILVVLLVFALMAGCSSNSGNTSKTATNTKTIGLVLSTQNNPFFVSLKNGVEKEAKKLGYSVTVLDSQNDSSKELSNVEDLIQQKVSVLLLNPVDSDAAVNEVKEANNNNIPVITLDRDVNGGNIVSNIASDNVKGGQMAADFLAKKLNNKGNIVELVGTPGASSTIERGKGFDDEISKYPNIKIISKQTANFDRSQGLSVMENILQAQPKIDAVFAQNDEMALGAIKAIKGANRQGILVVGFDGTADGLNAIKNGQMTATIAQQPELIGTLGVDTADKYLKGEKVARKIPAEIKLIEKN
ncbi:ribose ABC transporter substrate-binding protein RbsB [Thermoanaerobacterium thermosaccharolyticum]|uniref:Periplasmic binding protein/LacI transcriptional regulator n=1 Tax=Thermoanaerobacterium thermosaccharolyticum (strain ATCC 7956 / DSM 571 / NCIMB 9385 / NCA 3814 / NCTC 13789 / WDCM 00135 / 2032) TaxID=580327 RepID=D9TQI6_THETC|nr:ribose ABC transporter substrate-binding protein RbsB [Thermoanaerobacterium thermosaccharolyticum]ADL69220.1 periplasmic binding protein/LacI transcriptional regulator [Thermoanaerobacterium thermosaccharolyticum DSM 571]MBE0068678.1 ribose ABC transporter substrate-binding protein RbsB [Thermoanaerobacterium thermosaccharolyticum]MBE0228266.1 ribose ABC transporter substrate-binding protein RbsB [Thermoanaerobacterium thermosaccharolyticum]TCW31987.1 ribose-binding protein [Thermohydrogeni